MAENVPTSLCGVDRAQLGATIYDASEAAPGICETCSAALLAATDLAVATTVTITDGAALEAAKQSLRSLARLVPAGLTSDLVVYARACLARNDKRGAHEALVRWREEVRQIGLLRA